MQEPIFDPRAGQILLSSTVILKGEKMYRCPKCGSNNTSKERIMGADTMDRICGNCGYIGPKQEFKEKEIKPESK
jgi:predicted RNA-binding Zn-ribbon protein involved in translation (DUF1610 family)